MSTALLSKGAAKGQPLHEAEAQRNPLNRVAGGKMVGWDNYVTVLDPEFLEETARAQYQAKAAATAVGDPGTMSRL